MSELAGFRVAVLATDGFEESELTEPVKTLRDAGAQVTILSLEAGEIQGVRHDLDKTVRVKVDRTIRDVSTEQFDAVQLPGGTVNADTMRMVPEVQDFLRAMQGAGKPFAANAREDAGPASFTCLSAGPARSAASCSAASAPSGTATRSGSSPPAARSSSRSPLSFASSFSGFYLPLMIVLWLLMLRGIAIAFRGHLDNAAWTPFWDIVFGFSSLLLILFFGAALGNVVRGVPLDGQGNFLEPLWTNFRLGPQPGVIDWYTTLTGVAAVFALTQHGALWVALKTEGAVNARARSIGRPTWWAVTVITIVLTAVTFHVQPQIPASLAARPWTYVCPALAVAGQIAVWRCLPSGDELRAFLGSCAYLLGMMTSVVFGLYPVVLPASTNPAPALTIYNAKAADYGLRVGLAWWMSGMILVTVYCVFTYRHFAGKVRLDTDDGY